MATERLEHYTFGAYRHPTGVMNIRAHPRGAQSRRGHLHRGALHPPIPAFIRLYSLVRLHNRGTQQMGRDLRGAVNAAGFVNVAVTAACDVKAADADTLRWGEVVARKPWPVSEPRSQPE